MSQENVEIVQGAHRGASRRDDRVSRDYFDPEIVWDTSASGMPSAGVYQRSPGSASGSSRDWLAAWERLRDRDQRLHRRGRCAWSCLPASRHGPGQRGQDRARLLRRLGPGRSSKVGRFRLFESREQALEAAASRGCLCRLGAEEQRRHETAQGKRCDPGQGESPAGWLVRGFATINSNGKSSTRAASFSACSIPRRGSITFDLGAPVKTAVASMDAEAAGNTNVSVSLPVQSPCAASNTDAGAFVNGSGGTTNDIFHVAFLGK